MTHHARLNLIMFGTIICLMVFLYFRPQSSDIREYSISPSSIETVQNLRIVKQQKEVVLKQLDNHWYMIKPVKARADEEKIIEILKILTATSNQRFSLADLERFDLDRPNIQLYIDDEYFGFGGYTTTTNQQYVATLDYVYLISPRYALKLPLSAGELISPRLLAPNEIPIKFELNHLTLELQNENWNIIVQDSEEALNEEIIKHWIQLWQTANARELTLNQELDTDFVERGLIKITLQDGQDITLRKLQNDTEVMLLRVNEGIGYHFNVDVGRQLLDPHAIKSNQILLDN